MSPPEISRSPWLLMPLLSEVISSVVPENTAVPAACTAWSVESMVQLPPLMVRFPPHLMPLLVASSVAVVMAAAADAPASVEESAMVCMAAAGIALASLAAAFWRLSALSGGVLPLPPKLPPPKVSPSGSSGGFPEGASPEGMSPEGGLPPPKLFGWKSSCAEAATVPVVVMVTAPPETVRSPSA